MTVPADPAPESSTPKTGGASGAALRRRAVMNGALLIVGSVTVALGLLVGVSLAFHGELPPARAVTIAVIMAVTMGSLPVWMIVRRGRAADRS